MTDNLPPLPQPEYVLSSMMGNFISFRAKGFKHKKGDALYTADQLCSYAEEAVRLEREAQSKLLSDLRWRMDDIRDMLMKEGMGGNRIYGCDEWSTPTVNLQRAIDKIDEAIRSRSEAKP